MAGPRSRLLNRLDRANENVVRNAMDHPHGLQPQPIAANYTFPLPIGGR